MAELYTKIETGTIPANSGEVCEYASESLSSEALAPPPPELSPPPDGGFVAWLQCAAGFCVFFNTWGLLTSFGMTWLAQDSTAADPNRCFPIILQNGLTQDI
jgi:hypothetical protein